MSEILSALITTVGALAGSFGGFTLAARAQRRQAEQNDARAVRDADRARSMLLDDERHDFQLNTLILLQELTRRMARSTFLVIREDRETIKRVGGYQLLENQDPDNFVKAIEFAHNVARVTDTALRKKLETFADLCHNSSLPPHDGSVLSPAAALDLQDRRFGMLVEVATETADLLNEHLRKELDRTAR